MGVVRYIWNKVDRWDRALEKFKNDRKFSKKAKDLEKSRKDLVEGVESTATQMHKKEDSKTAEKLRDIAKKLKEAPDKAIKELKALLKKAKLSPEAKQELKALLEKFKESFKKLLNSINVKTQHNKHVEKVVINFYEKVNEILKEYFRICDYGIRTHIMSACKDNVVILILEAIKSLLERYARTHKPSVVNKWYKYLLKNIETIGVRLDKQVNDLVLKNNRENKEALLNGLCSIQNGLCATLLKVLNLKKYVDDNNIGDSSLGVVVNGDKYKEWFASTERTLESYMDDRKCEEMCGNLLGLGPAFDSEPVELY